jgi:pyruvate dehydrogenase E1 component beta subunit
MKEAMEKNPRAIIYGQGVTDHLGVFGSTKGLESVFGSERVFETPIAEDSMTGFAIGAALNGLYPIHVHIRNDFMLLSMNQLVNQAAKYKYMHGGNFTVPMLARSIVGRGWGQGSQHSQSLQSLFAHIPGLTVIMPASSQSVLDCYDYAVNEYKNPVISIEHRLLYDYMFEVDDKPRKKNPFSSNLVRSGKDITVIASSIMVLEALRAAIYVKENEDIDIEVIDINCITHPDVNLILESISKTGRVIVADTGWASYGVCAEVARIIATHSVDILKLPIREVTIAKATCPTSKYLEDFYYPDVESIINEIYSLCFETDEHNKKLPDPEYKNKLYKNFKGPF